MQFSGLSLYPDGGERTVKHKKKKKGINPSAMRCQYCGGTVLLRSADGIYHENTAIPMYMFAAIYLRCDAYVRTHPGHEYTRRYIG